MLVKKADIKDTVKKAFSLIYASEVGFKHKSNIKNRQ